MFFAFIFIDPPDVGEWQFKQPPSALRVSAYVLPTPSLVGRRLHKFRLRLTTASVCRREDCSRRLPSTQSRHLHSATLHYGCRALRICALVTNFSYAPLQRLFPTPLLRHGVGRVSITVCPATYADFSFYASYESSSRLPSREDRPPISVLQSERTAIRQHLPPDRGLMNARASPVALAI